MNIQQLRLYVDLALAMKNSDLHMQNFRRSKRYRALLKASKRGRTPVKPI